MRNRKIKSKLFDWLTAHKIFHSQTNKTRSLNKATCCGDSGPFQRRVCAAAGLLFQSTALQTTNTRGTQWQHSRHRERGTNNAIMKKGFLCVLWHPLHSIHSLQCGRTIPQCRLLVKRNGDRLRFIVHHRKLHSYTFHCGGFVIRDRICLKRINRNFFDKEYFHKQCW